MNEFERQLDDDPHDWDLRLVYADHLDERGEEMRANGQRWQAMNQKAPTAPFSQSAPWLWWSSICGGTRAQLDKTLVNAAVYRQHTTRQSAELALAERLHELEMEAVS